MPNTVHKVLCHGCEIISFFELPVGQLAELEAGKLWKRAIRNLEKLDYITDVKLQEQMRI